MILRSILILSVYRNYFQERVGECSVQTIVHSKDKKWIFVALKFKSTAVAEDVIGRYWLLASLLYEVYCSRQNIFPFL